MASRFGMLSNGTSTGNITMKKIRGQDNCSDALNKPIVGPSFDRHRATLLGLSHISPQTLQSLGPDLRSRVEQYLQPQPVPPTQPNPYPNPKP